MFLPHPRVKVSIVGSLRDREVACSALDRQGSNFESCVWRTVSSQSSHHPQEVLLAQFSLYVHKSGLKPDSFHFIYKSADVRFLFLFATEDGTADNKKDDDNSSELPDIAPAGKNRTQTLRIEATSSSSLPRKEAVIYYYCLPSNNSNRLLFRQEVIYYYCLPSNNSNRLLFRPEVIYYYCL